MEVTEENDEKQLEPNRILKRSLPLYLFYCWRNLNSCRIPCYVQWSNKMLSKIYQWVWYSAYGLHKLNFPSLVFVFFPFSSGLSWWRSYQNWGSFMIQTPWSSWPGLGRRIYPRSQIQSTHHIEANLNRLFLQIKFHCASCPWLVRVWACPCARMHVSRRLFVGESVWWVMRADGYPWIRHGSAGKDPAVGRALTHLRVSVAGLSIKSITLMGSEMELWFGNAPNCRWCCCVFAHLCTPVIFCSSGWMYSAGLAARSAYPTSVQL